MGLSPEQVAEAAELELETLKVLCGDVKGGDKDEKEFGNA